MFRRTPALSTLKFIQSKPCRSTRQPDQQVSLELSHVSPFQEKGLSTIEGHPPSKGPYLNIAQEIFSINKIRNVRTLARRFSTHHCTETAFCSGAGKQQGEKRRQASRGLATRTALKLHPPAARCYIPNRENHIPTK
ncbi:hypothetical protein JTE90_026346 [Oedothorax gibbosus]|uniref:Uncharacterized protein n=1 Tax=Oedothorax gibbosus TaxID=931172 RepID=A0AAV6TI01_9ARAC|nr:hypothetical protein JTE90_026346 [Oedothorax gibbosus]